MSLFRSWLLILTTSLLCTPASHASVSFERQWAEQSDLPFVSLNRGHKHAAITAFVWSETELSESPDSGDPADALLAGQPQNVYLGSISSQGVATCHSSEIRYTNAQPRAPPLSS